MRGNNLTIADSYELWTPHRTGAKPLGESHVQLSQPFFESIMEAPVPVDMRALKALRGSPLRIDIYTWLVHRLPYLRRRTTIPWPLLAAQFGGDYKELHKFRAAFTKHLRQVLAVYPEAIDAAEPTKAGLIIRRAAPAIHAGRAAFVSSRDLFLVK